MTKKLVAIGGFLLVCAPLWLAAADATFALTRGWWPENTVDWVFLAVGFSGIFAMCFALLLRRFRAWCGAHAAEFFLLGAMMIVSLAAVELVLRTIPGAPPPLFHQAPAHLSVTVSRKDETPKKTFTTNSDGIRGPEYAANADLRILCVGGSTTQCHYMDDSKAWTYLLMLDLQQLLPAKSVWVGSTGIPGFATPQHLKYVDTNPLFDRYTHAVFLVGVNDVLHWLSFKPAQNQAPQPKAPAPLWHKAVVYQRVTTLFSDSSSWVLNAADAWPLELARRKRVEGKLLDTYPSPQRALHGYRERIGAMIDRCQALGVQPVFATQPTLWAKDLPPEIESQLWMGISRVENEFMGTAPLRELMDQFNAALMETCQARGVPVVDLAFMNGNTDYFFDDCHFTERGAVVVAETIANAIAQRQPAAP